MEDVHVIDALRELVTNRKDEALALCPVDARLALEILIDEWSPAAAERRLLTELAAAGGPAELRNRLLSVAAEFVEQLAEDGGCPLFRPDVTVRAHAGVRLAAAQDDELVAAMRGGTPPLMDPAAAWDELTALALVGADEVAGNDAQLGKTLAARLRGLPAFRGSVVDTRLSGEKHVRTVCVTAAGSALVTVTQRTAGTLTTLHAAGAVVGRQARALNPEEARLLALAATALASDPRLYVDLRSGVIATSRQLRTAALPDGTASWRTIGNPYPIGVGRLRRLLGTSPVYLPSGASPWQLAACVGATTVRWLEDFPLGDLRHLIALAWHDDERPIAVTTDGRACMPAAFEVSAGAPVSREPDSDETARRRGALARNGRVRPEAFVDRLTAAQVDRVWRVELPVTAWLDDGSVLLGTIARVEVVVAPDGSVSKPTHVPIGGVLLPRGIERTLIL